MLGKCQSFYLYLDIKLPCSKPEGHKGKHRFSIKWENA